MIRAVVTFMLGVTGLTPKLAAQTVVAKEGNIIFKGRNGTAIEITSSGMDCDPSLSADRRLVVFVRRTPSAKISTALEETGKVDFLFRGEGVEVIKSGIYAGYLIGLKAIPHALPPPHIFQYWLLEPNGKDVGEIGEKVEQQGTCSSFWRLATSVLLEYERAKQTEHI